MRFRFLNRLRLSPRAQRRLERLGANVRGVVTYPVGLVFALMKAIGRTIANWWESRNLRFLLQGLPSLVLGIGMFVFGVVMFFQDRSVLANDYHRQGDKSMVEAYTAVRSSKDAKASVAMAQTCFRRLSILPSDKDEVTFKLAQTYEILRQPQAQDEILKMLAPLPKAPGERVKSYGPANLQMAQRLAGVRPMTVELLNAIEMHLTRAKQWNAEPTTSEAEYFLYNLLLQRNRTEAAEQNLVEAVNRAGDRRPDWRLVLADFYQRQGKREAAAAQVDKAGKAFRDRLDKNVDDHQARFALIQIANVNGKFAEAKELCHAGAAQSGNSPLANKYLMTLAQVLMREYDVRTADPKATPEERFSLLEEAMTINPSDRLLLDRLVVFTRLTGTPAEKARKHFAQLLETGANSAIAHLIIGTDDWKHGDEKSARYHWEKAFEIAPNMPMVTNNLAWSLAFIPPEDLTRARAIMETTLQKVRGTQADDPRFHGTYGHILAKLGLHKEAIEELERSMSAYSNDPRLFEQLAESCGQVGRQADADRYKKRAEELKANAAPAATAGPSSADPKDAKGPSVTDPKAPAAAPDAKAPAAPMPPKP